MGKKKTARGKQSGQAPQRMRRSQATPIQIENNAYAQLKDQPLLITQQLREELTKRKFRDGTRAIESLTNRGFRGGKHLLELIREGLGKDQVVVLSHEASSLKGKTIVINYDAFREAGQQRFFEVYRETGIRAATDFLNEQFPESFTRTSEDVLPKRREVKRILDRLPDAAEAVSKRDRSKLPDQIAALVERQGTEFAIDLLSSVDAAIPRGQEKLRQSFRDVVSRLANEPKALAELTSLMDQWSLLQATSLLNILRSRLNTIETFGELIVDDNTYELRGDRSVHRVLERSMWLLDDQYWIAQSNKTLRTLIGKRLEKADEAYADRRPDFACVDDRSRRNVIVEIKRPSIELKQAEVNQAELYLRIIKRYQSPNRKTNVYLVGREVSDEARELAELRGYPILWTYSDLIGGARQRYQEYLRIVEGDSA